MAPITGSANPDPATVTVGIVAICGEPHLERCLAALAAQRNAPPFDVVVAAAPRLGELPRIRQAFPDVRIRMDPAVMSPIDLAAMAVTTAHGEVILLTEDHCVPDAEWVGNLTRTIQRNGSAVGGAVDPLDPETMTAFDWAFYFVDFHKYRTPLTAGIAEALSECNVAYRRSNLEALDEPWRTSFHETRIHIALAKQGPPLWIEPRASVRAGRRVYRSDALRERYAFGRYYACRRVEPPYEHTRAWLVLGSPLLPLLLLGRMARSSARDDYLSRRFLRSLPDLAALVLAWSFGEMLGYVTAHGPKTMEAAPERNALDSREPS